MSDMLLKRDVIVSWQEPMTKEEVTHQIEPGQPWPKKRRTGEVLQFIYTFEPLPSGKFDNKLQAVILDPVIGQIVMLPISQLRYEKKAR